MIKGTHGSDAKRNIRRGIVLAAVTLVMITVIGSGAVAGDVVKSSEIVKALGTAPTEVGGIKLRFRGVTVAKQRTRAIDIPIHFETDSDRIQGRSLIQIKEIAAALKTISLDRGTIMVVGHTDSRGSADYNLALSQRRAKAVVGTLVRDYGIPAAMLAPEGRGESEPKVAGERSEADFAANRRVELRVVGGT